jgi:hypothetical protein
MFKILFILLGILILLNITYGTSLHRSSQLTNSTMKINSTNDDQYDYYYDHYDYYVSNAYRHKIKINFMFFLIIFFLLNK